jgi:hypothetical protein
VAARIRWSPIVGALLLVLCLPAAAREKKDPKPPGDQPPPDIEEYATDAFGVDFTFWGMLNFSEHGVGGGGGIQFGYPLLGRGLISSERFLDALHIEGGLEVLAWSFKVNDASAKLTVYLPQVGMRYFVYLTDRLALSLAAKVGVGAPDATGMKPEVEFFWSTCLGVFFDLTDWLVLRAEGGWGAYRDILKIGAMVRF